MIKFLNFKIKSTFLLSPAKKSRSQWFYIYQQYKSYRQSLIMKLESYKDSRSQGIMSYSEKCKMKFAFNDQKDRDIST